MDEDLKQTLEKLVQLTEENNKLLKKINFFVNTQRIWGAIKILIIVVPIILAYIYLPKWLAGFQADPIALLSNPWLETYTQGLTEQMLKNADVKNVDLNNIDPAKLEQYKKLLTK